MFFIAHIFKNLIDVCNGKWQITIRVGRVFQSSWQRWSMDGGLSVDLVEVGDETEAAIDESPLVSRRSRFSSNNGTGFDERCVVAVVFVDDEADEEERGGDRHWVVLAHHELVGSADDELECGQTTLVPAAELEPLLMLMQTSGS